MPKKPSKPHDEFFKAAFGRHEVALEYLERMLPEELRQELDLERLERVNGSFVSPALQEYFSDVVYRCPLKRGGPEVCPCFIFEHKSKPEPRPHLQLLRYMLDSWEEQLALGQKNLSPIVPIIVYHGKRGWRKRKMSTYFGKNLPANLLPYLPQFDYVLTNVQNLSNQQILELCRGLLINTFLMMKHIWEPEYILQNPQLIFINLQEPLNQSDFIVFMLAYLLKNTEIAREKVQNFVQKLPKTLNPTVMSAYDLIIEDAVGEFKELLKKEQKKLREVAHEVKKTQLLLKKQELEIEEILLLKEEARAHAEEARAREEEARAREEEARAREEEARAREEEARAREEEARAREEEARAQIQRSIIYLHQNLQVSASEIAAILGVDVDHVEAVLRGE
jgi:predicted transposase/invertase (TIGR01784 family)